MPNFELSSLLVSEKELLLIRTAIFSNKHNNSTKHKSCFLTVCTFLVCHEDVVKIVELACKHNLCIIPFGGKCNYEISYLFKVISENVFCFNLNKCSSLLVLCSHNMYKLVLFVALLKLKVSERIVVKH